MKAVIQRVKEAAVDVDGKTVGKIGRGFMILFGAEKGDTEADAVLLAEKIVKLRIFSDENGKMNLSLSDVGGEVLAVSNFTLCADYRHGNRPDYMMAEAPDRANELYEYFKKLIAARLGEDKVQSGIFGADMAVSLVNDGPVTIVMEAEMLKKPKNG